MLAPNGNIDQVYKALQRSELRKVKRKATIEINHAVSNTASMEAEIVEGSTANWYLVHTYPGKDLKAMRYLARRRFGVFRPMQQRRSAKVEGQPIGGMEPCFPGWLFVYCWGIEKLRWRILSAPGVMGIFSDHVSLRPITIPDEFVQRLRAQGWVYEEGLTYVGRSSDRNQQRIKPRRPDKRERKLLDKLRKEVKQRGFEWDQFTWDGVNALEPHQRIALLSRTLCPPSMVATSCGGGT